MHEEGEADPPAQVPPVLAGETGALRGIPRDLDRAIEDRLGSDALGQPLAGERRIAGPDHVAAAHLGGREAKDVGDPVDLPFHGETGLRCPEAAESAVRRMVRGHDPRGHPDVLTLVDAGGVDRPTGEDDGTQGGVGTAIHEEVDLHRGDRAVLLDAAAVAGDRGVSLRGREHVLVPRIDELDGAPRLERQEGGMARDHRGVFLLPAESPAGIGGDHPDLLRWQTEEDDHRAMDVVGTLHRPLDRDPPRAIRHRDHPVGFDVELLLGAGAVRSLDDPLRGRKTCFEGTLLDPEGLEDVVLPEEDLLSPQRGLDREDRWFRFVLDLDGGRGPVGDLLRRSGDEEDRFRLVHHPILGKTGLILLDEGDHVFPGNVPVIDDHGFGRKIVPQADRPDPPVGDRGADRLAEPHPRFREVVDVTCAPRNFSGTVPADDPLPYAHESLLLRADRATDTGEPPRSRWSEGYPPFPLLPRVWTTRLGMSSPRDARRDDALTL